MSCTEIRNITIDQVKEGQKLTPIIHQVTASSVVLGAMATQDWRPMHHDKDFAINRNGVKDIFMNTPIIAAWFERCITDWSGPLGRLGSTQIKIDQSVFPGDEMVVSGQVNGIHIDATDCSWVVLELAITVDGNRCSSCRAQVALPNDDGDNPWNRKGLDWQP